MAAAAGTGFLSGCAIAARLIVLWPDSRPPITASTILLTLAGGALGALGAVGIAARERRRHGPP
ncbi:MAG: hypothetical protein RLN63_06420, partial [Miltoncostaeaceae bacterium]